MSRRIFAGALLGAGLASLPWAGPAVAQQQGWTGVEGVWSGVSGETSAVQGAMEALGATVQGNEIVVDLPADVLFDFDKSDIRPDAAAALEKLLTIINAEKGSVRIEGHTDAKGGDAYNQALSMRRAEAVKAWLAGRGVASERMTTMGWGEQRPVAPNAKANGEDDPEGRQRNRRVQVVIARG